MPYPFERFGILIHIRKSKISDTSHDSSDERLRPLDFALLDVLRESMELVFVSVFLYEEELVLSLAKWCPARREIEEDGIEGELELILPLLHLHILTSLPIEGIESSTGLIVCDDE